MLVIAIILTATLTTIVTSFVITTHENSADVLGEKRYEAVIDGKRRTLRFKKKIREEFNSSAIYEGIELEEVR